MRPVMRRTLLLACIDLRLATVVPTGDQRLKLTGQSLIVRAVDVFPDGRSVITGAGDNSAQSQIHDRGWVSLKESRPRRFVSADIFF